MKYEREYPELRVLNGELLLYEMIQFLPVLVLRTREEIMLGYDISNIFLTDISRDISLKLSLMKSIFTIDT